jgi:hypothetical protein
MSLTKLFQGIINNSIIPCQGEFAKLAQGIIRLFTARESLVSDILAGDGKITNLSYSVRPN